VTVVSLSAFSARSTVSASPETVTAALEDAEGLIAEFLRRPGLGVVEHAERLALVNGRVFPTYTPLTAVPAGWEIEGDVAVADSPPALPGPFLDPYATGQVIEFVYSAGWTALTLPPTLLRGVVRVAAALITEPGPGSLYADLGGISGDVASISTAEQSISFRDRGLDPTDLDMLAPGLTKSIMRWWVR
jgi:hypothetical protein